MDKVTKTATKATDNINTQSAGEGVAQTTPTPAITDSSMANPNEPGKPGATAPGETGDLKTGEGVENPHESAETPADRDDSKQNEFEFEPMNPDELDEATKAEAIELDEEMLDLLDRLTAHYPSEKTFHFTSDGQPFLDANLADAKAHQKTIAPDDQVKSISVE